MSEPDTDVGPMTLRWDDSSQPQLDVKGDWIVTNVTAWNYDKGWLTAWRWSRDGKREKLTFRDVYGVRCEDRRFGDVG